MSGAMSVRRSVRKRSNPAGWRRARLGVFVPLGAVVVVAIVCIVVAALTSAQRADDVALKRERDLLTRAIVNHAEWSLRRLKTVVELSTSVAPADIERTPDVAQPRLASWLSALSDHDLVLVVNSSDEIVYMQPGQRSADLRLTKAAILRFRNLVGLLRGNQATSGGALRLLEDESGTVFMADVGNRLALVTATALGETGAENPTGLRHPMILTLRTIGQSLLSNISTRLQLADLRLVPRDADPVGNSVHDFVDERGGPIASAARMRPRCPCPACLSPSRSRRKPRGS